MTSTTTDPRLRMAPPYIDWVPGTVNLLRTAPKVPTIAGTADSSNGVGGGPAWPEVSGQV